jgi:hypothetical protein
MSFDLRVAKKLVMINNRCKQKGLRFDLSLATVKRLLQRKTCYFTGMALTPSTLTFDRVNNSRGYEEGNVVACHLAFNQFKSFIENPDNNITLNQAKKGIQKWSKDIEL